MSIIRFAKHDAEITKDTLRLKGANYRAVTNIFPDKLPNNYRFSPWPVTKGHDLQGGLWCGAVNCYVLKC